MYVCDLPCYLGSFHSDRPWWDTGTPGWPHCESPDNERVSFHQAVWAGNEGMGGKTCVYAGHLGWMAQGMTAKKKMTTQWSYIEQL